MGKRSLRPPLPPLPPDRDPRLCERYIRSKGRFCRLFKRIHGGDGKHCKIHRRGTRAINAPYKDIMPRFYSKVLGKTLQVAVAEALDCPVEEQLQVYDELALIRQTAIPAVALFGAALDMPETSANRESRNDLIAHSSTLAREVLKEVVSTCETAARIEEKRKDRISLTSVGLLVEQILRCAWDVFGEDIDKATQFEKLVRERVKLPKSGEEGTTLTPDMDVLDMDMSVPRVEHTT